jgi:LysM repeat protein
MYNVTVEDIYRLNPESRNVIRIGDVLKIPQESGSYIYHTIQPQENIYSVSQKYLMKGDDIVAANPGLSEATFSIGKTIRIPTNRVTSPITGGNEVENMALTNALLTRVYPLKEVNVIKIALLLPLGTTRGDTIQNAARHSMVEFLEGFLLALERLKKERISIDPLIIKDIGSGTNEIPAILKEREMQDIHLLIGGFSDEQIKLLSRFSKERGIPYVIPSFRSDELYSNPNIYQINTPHSHLYSKASLAFINKYGRDNIIIVSDSAGTSNQKEFINSLMQDLQSKRVPYKAITMGVNFYNDIRTLLSNNQNNVIVPDDDSAETLSKLTAQMKSIVENQREISLSLFGYPAWQVYSAKLSDDFFRLNTTFYSFFFSDPTSEDVKTFYSTFYKYYTKVIANSFPKFGILGYDMGLYFIRLIDRYGAQFDSHINDLQYKGIQTDFSFERVNNWGGFINTNIYFITYNPDFTITKTSVK